MSDDEITRMIAFLAEVQSVTETGAIWIDLAAAEAKAAGQRLGQMYDDLYAEMDDAFWELASHYDDGWDILRES